MTIHQYFRVSIIMPYALLFVLPMIPSKAQNSAFTGTFFTEDGSLTLRLKSMEDQFHGTLQSGNTAFAIKATTSNTEMAGTVYTGTSSYTFTAKASDGRLYVLSEGQHYRFYKYSKADGLDDIDLTPYFQTTTPDGQVSGGPINNPKTYEGKNQLYFEYIAGSQLVFYTRTSYLNDSRASSITYVNFCPDGRFGINYDGGFSVEGDYGGNAQGASHGASFGTWEITKHHGYPALTLHFANGEVGVYPINEQYLVEGRWSVGNTQYAIQRNKAICR